MGTKSGQTGAFQPVETLADQYKRGGDIGFAQGWLDCDVPLGTVLIELS